MQWTPPDLTQRPQRALSVYSQDGYVLGNSTPGTLKRIASLFKNGPKQWKDVQDKATESPVYAESPDHIIGAPEPVELDSTALDYAELEAHPSKWI